MAQRLEVSERTIYRDVADLQAQGVPIEGEAGVGYRLGKGFELPPLMFTVDEARALVASARMSQVWQDPDLAQASQMALGKILSVLPPSARAAAQAMAVYAPAIGMEEGVQHALAGLRDAPINVSASNWTIRMRGACHPSHGAPAGLLLLGQGLDLGGLV